MSQFTSIGEAKEFLVNTIVEESQREGISLSEVEEKMLYFTETASTPPDIWEVNEIFDRDYIQADYEDKIAGLIRGFRKYARQHSSADLKSWDDAVRLLREEDHYLLVMVSIASSSPTMRRPLREETSARRIIRLTLIGAAGFIACSALLMIYMWLRY